MGKKAGDGQRERRRERFHTAERLLHSAYDRSLAAPADPEAERLLRLLLDPSDHELPSC